MHFTHFLALLEGSKDYIFFGCPSEKEKEKRGGSVEDVATNAGLT